MIRLLKSIVRAHYGGVKHRREHAELLATVPSVSEAIQKAESRFPELQSDQSNDAPVFLLASSWRAGSTALQRLVASSGEVLVWGEPYRNCNYIQLLSESFRSFSKNHPHRRELIRGRDGEDVSQKWIATMSPPPEALKLAHVRFFEALFCDPARELGYGRWGLKEVRLDMGHAHYLRWLFPKARFVLTYRNPYDAYRSYRVFPTWYARWPDKPILSAKDFGRHWLERTEAFVSAAQEDDAWFLLAYEDLRDEPERVARELSDHLGLKLDASPLERMITGRGEKNDAKRPPEVSAAERRALRGVVGDLADRLGLETPS